MAVSQIFAAVRTGRAGLNLIMVIDTWILMSIAAAFLQNLRSLLQRRLAGKLSVNGASFVRFAYALPFAWLYALVVVPADVAGSVTLQFLCFCLFTLS